jgi:hypothetical protein
MLIEIDISALRRGTPQHQRGAGRRINLPAVMHLQDLDVELLIERLRDALDQSGKQIHSHAHVAGLDDDCAFPRFLDQTLALTEKPRRSDNMYHSTPGRELRKHHGSSGNREVEQPVGFAEKRLDIARYNNATRPESRELARIAPDYRGSGSLHGARQSSALAGSDGMDEGASHAPAGARYHQPHVRHFFLQQPGAGITMQFREGKPAAIRSRGRKGPMRLPMLRLYEDILANSRVFALPRSPRMIFVVHGTISIGGRSFTDEDAWHGKGAVAVHAEASGASLWRWELSGTISADTTPPSVVSREKLSAELHTLPKGELLLRGDSVGFPAGGCAYLHRHHGPGIRCLIEGGIRIDAQGQSTSYGPGGAWYETGPDPVFAQAASDRPSRFIRVMLLPRELMGRSSLQYVNEADKSKPRVQQYKILADVPITRPTVQQS